MSNIQITFSFTDVAAAAALFAKLTGAELSAATVSAPPAPKPKAEKTAATPAAPAVESPAPSPRTAEAAPSTSDPSPAAPEKASTSTAPAAAATSAADTVDYPTLQKAVITLHKLDPNAAVPIAQALHGVPNPSKEDAAKYTFKTLKPEQWAEAHRLVVAKTAELQAA